MPSLSIPRRCAALLPAVALLAASLFCRAGVGTNDAAWISRLPKVETSALKPAAESPQPSPAEDSFVNFSFDQVEIGAFVKLVGDMTGKRFVVSDSVKGKITVVSPRVTRDEIYPLFVSILESAGCSIVQEGDIFRVVALPDRATPLAPVVGADERIPASGIITKIFRLKNAQVADVRKLLESKVSGGKIGGVGAIEDTNHLIVTDTADNIRRIEKIIAEIDQPGLARVTEVIPLQFVGAEELADQLSAAMTDTETRADRLVKRLPAAPEGGSATARPPIIVASPHSNSLILVGQLSQLQELKRLIKMMDVDSTAGRGNLNAIFLKYISAEEAAKSLNALLSGPSGKKDEAGPQKRKIAIEASAANNALLVDATPSDFEVVNKLVEQLDRVQEQIHIEVLIAELSTSENLDLGVQMAALNMPSGVGGNALQAGSFVDQTGELLMKAVQQGIMPQGLSVGVAHGSSLDASGNLKLSYPALININAVKKDTRFKIRSNPSLLAQNNKEASVSIVNQIPILKSTIQGGTGTTRDVIQNIDRMDVGIKLKLTPSVIPGGQVRMILNPVIEAVVDQGPQNVQFAPTIARREVSTTVTVRDGEMIVIAGLTREDQTKNVQKVPILGSIPLIGWLFRHTVDGTQKSNVLIFVTPKIMASSGDAVGLRKRLEKKTGLKANEHQ